MKLPIGWREILNQARDSIGAGADAIAAAYERQIVEPHIDGIFDELEALEAELASKMTPMIQARDMAQSPFRPCQNCHEDFRYKSEDDWLCTVCRGQRAEMERRQGVEGDLLNANKVFR